ncbi:unnamed protein product [Somion occarium]|uniref:Uncharacterized protein n=1 Tax=Somion occarium TaxID=3059160 RepID=A0ABP1CZU3_9APHY
MDDDLSFGASVWGSTDSPTATPTLPPVLKPPSFSPALSSPQDSVNDFDDFGTPAETIAASGDEGDDDFGDFEDFGEAVEAGPSSVPSFNDAFLDEPRIPGASKDWQPLRVKPMPSLEEIRQQMHELLGPLWPPADPSLFHDRELRQVGGLNQILISPESRRMYDYLCPSTPPEIQPVNWTRSRIRRQHLIALGIPVNLDEVLPPSGGKLPPLQITTRPTSAPPGPSSASAVRNHAAATANNSRAGTPRSGTPQPGIRNSSLAAAQMRLGPQPELDEAKIETLLNLKPDDLSIMPVRMVESHLKALQDHTVQTSALLTYLLQTRDALQQDSETYNKLIGELVGEAQKMNTGKRLAGSRRGSAMS